MSFEQALKFVLKEEGGFVDNPRDPGGATNKGIIQNTYNTYRTNKSLPLRSVRDIEDHEVSDIYQSVYWIPAHCAELKTRIGICHMDWSANHGVSHFTWAKEHNVIPQEAWDKGIRGAIETLQEAVGVMNDGIFGPKTRLAIELEDEFELMKNYNNLRREWYKHRVVTRPDQAEFLSDWLGRVDRLEAYCESL